MACALASCDAHAGAMWCRARCIGSTGGLIYRSVRPDLCKVLSQEQAHSTHRAALAAAAAAAMRKRWQAEAAATQAKAIALYLCATVACDRSCMRPNLADACEDLRIH